MLKNLAEDGIINRIRDTKDSRVVNVFLTDKGKSLEKPVYDIWKEHGDILLDGNLLEEKLLLRRILKQLHDNLKNSDI